MINQLFSGLQKGKTFIYFLILVIVVTLTYSNHFHNSFHFDDSHTIQNNIFIRDLKNIPLFFKDGTTFSSLPFNQSYRPVVSASLAFDYWMGKGYDLFYFHLSTFILFLLQGILMFFFIFKIFDVSFKNKWNFYIAAIAVTWYLLHPANAETVNYIIARSDVQSTFFVVLGFALYIFSPFCKKTFLYLLPAGIGALAKPTAVMFAPLLFFYVLLFEQKLSLTDLFKREKIKQVFSAVKSSLPAFVFCAFMYKWVDHFTPQAWQPGGISAWNFLITQPFVILHYFITFFLPFGLSADTDWKPLTGIGNSKFFIGCAFIFLMILFAFLSSKNEKHRPVTFGIVWFFIALIPSSSIIPLAEVLNDHRIFFPYIGLVISVCWSIGLLLMNLKKQFEHSAVKYERVLLCIVLLILSGYAYGTRQRNKVWNSEESLWYDVTVKSPGNGRGLMNYGLTKMSKGEYDEAEKYFMQALKLTPNYWTLHINLGVLKQATGDKAAAENYFRTAISLKDDYPDAWYYYGRFLCKQSRYSEAIPRLAKCLELAAAHPEARSMLMKAYYETGEWNKLNELAQNTLQVMPGNEEALKYLDASKNKKGKAEMLLDEIKNAPTAEKYLDLSLAYYNEGLYEKCIDACNSALQLKPGYADAYSNMCAAFNSLKQWDRAIEACNAAIKANPQHKLATGNLNWAKQEKAKEK